MGKIVLHKRMHLNDNEGVKREYEANDIYNINPVFGNDDDSDTTFYIRGIQKEQECIESANMVRRMVEENREPSESAISIGSYISGDQTNNNISGDQINQKGIMLWFKDIKFISGFISGIVASLLANLIFAIYSQ